jgi:hypothetical protein
MNAKKQGTSTWRLHLMLDGVCRRRWFSRVWSFGFEIRDPANQQTPTSVGFISNKPESQ